MACPVYLFTGFLDSGKTTLIKDTLSDENFMEGVDRTLIICFEEGDEEYGDKWLLEHKACIEYFDDVAELTPEKMQELDTIYHPAQVFIEYNGSIAVSEDLLNNMPEFWPLVEILTPVDASTFQNYITNMRGIMFEQLKYSDVAIINRCTEDTNAMMIRGNVKAINKRAQIFYEGAFGAQVEMKSGTLPFDLTAPLIEINDDDYGLWYMDCGEDPEKYNEKKVKLKGIYSQNIPGYKQSFILGRQAMVCCNNDTSLCGVTVTGVKIEEMKIGDWVEVQGTLKTLPLDNGGKTIVLYAERIQHVQPLEDPYVYFN